MFYLYVTQFVQERLPQAVLRQIIRHSLREENMSCIATAHYPLCDVDPRPCHVRATGDIFDVIHRAAVHSHPDLNPGIFL